MNKNSTLISGNTGNGCRLGAKFKGIVKSVKYTKFVLRLPMEHAGAKLLRVSSHSPCYRRDGSVAQGISSLKRSGEENWVRCPNAKAHRALKIK